MANNCLVTKLKGSVDKDLPILGESFFIFENLEGVQQTGYAVYMPVSTPVILKLNQSYFTDSAGTANLGDEIEYDGTGNIWVKPLITDTPTPTKLYIKNKYAPTKFICATSATTIDTVVGINNETLAWAVNITEINLAQGLVCDDLVPPVAFKRLIKLSKFVWGNYQEESNWVINELAEAQIANGRDYTTNPTLELSLSASGYTKYYNGSTYVQIPHNKVFVIFKNGGYELHDTTADGTLLYDSTL